MPTVLHILNASDAGGLSKYVIDVGAAMRERGWRVVVACDRGAWHERLLASGLEVIEVPLMGGIGGFLKSARVLRKWRDANGIDLIHAHYRRATRLGRLIQKRRSPPILYTLHLSHLNVSGWRRWVSDFGDHVHVASEDARQWIVDVAKVDPTRVTLIPHGIDVGKWPVTTDEDRAAARRELNLRDEDIIAVFVGRLSEQKRPDWVVDAAASLGTEKCRWLIVGDGPERAALEAKVGGSGTSSVRFLGERDPLTPYRAADLFVSSSWREGFGYAPAEALSTGLPVLRTRTSGTHETIVEGVTGRSVPIDKNAFIDACREMLADPAALRAMRPACAAHARANLRFDQQLARTQSLYERLLDGV